MIARSPSNRQTFNLNIPQVKRTSMGDNVVLKPEIILPSRMLGKLPDKKENIQTTKPTNGHVIEKEEVSEHQPAVMKRSYSESSKDRRLIATKNGIVNCLVLYCNTTVTLL